MPADPLKSNQNLLDFENYVREVEGTDDTPGNPKAERVVRLMLGNVAEDCPIPVLTALGRCLVEYRRKEMRDEARNN